VGDWKCGSSGRAYSKREALSSNPCNTKKIKGRIAIIERNEYWEKKTPLNIWYFVHYL
jgi:hypothetical protein